MVKLNYVDTIKIVDPALDGYGDETIGTQTDVKALFHQTTGTNHSGNVDIITADAHAYVDPADPFIINNWNRLEGMLVFANPFSSPAADAWYRITSVIVGQDKLLTNQIDNIHIYMKKTAGLDNGL